MCAGHRNRRVHGEVRLPEGVPLCHWAATSRKCFRRAALHESSPPARTEITVLFLTIALAALKLDQDPVAQIRVVCQALGRWSAAIKKQIILTIRAHPHENPAPDFLQRIQAFAPSGVTVRMADRTKPILGQLKKSDLVLGHITMGLFEARSLGKQAIALEVTDHPPELVTAMESAGIAFLPLTPIGLPHSSAALSTHRITSVTFIAALPRPSLRSAWIS